MLAPTITRVIASRHRMCQVYRDVLSVCSDGLLLQIRHDIDAKISDCETERDGRKCFVPNLNATETIPEMKVFHFLRMGNCMWSQDRCYLIAGDRCGRSSRNENSTIVQMAVHANNVSASIIVGTLNF